MKTGCGYPMGPFELLDVVGLDVALAIQRELYLEFRERGFSPAPLLEQLVTAGYLGRKVGPRLPHLRLSPVGRRRRRGTSLLAGAARRPAGRGAVHPPQDDHGGCDERDDGGTGRQRGHG